MKQAIILLQGMAEKGLWLNNNNKALFSLKHVTFVNEKKWGVRMHVDI